MILLPLLDSRTYSAERPNDMDKTYGALLLGTFIGLILYGLGLHQLYRYFRLYSKDLVFVRSLVILTMIFETVHTFLTLHACYFYLVDNYLCQDVYCIVSGPSTGIDVPHHQLLALSTGMIMLIAQMFFARRLYKVGPGYRIAVFLATAFLVGESAFAIAATVEMYSTHSLHAFWKRTWLVSGCYGMATVADTILTIALIVVLQRSRTGMKGTDDLIDVLIVYTFNTGLKKSKNSRVLPQTSSEASAMPKNFIYLCFNIITSKTTRSVYANTLLAAVNSRAFSSQGGSEVFELDRIPRPHGILRPATRSTTSAHWDTRQADEHCTSVLNIKAAGRAEGDVVPELRREVAREDDARMDSKRSSTVVGHPFAVQLPASPDTRPAAEDVKGIAIRE
ncbi:hypothetical protein C8T65DRAFT_748981 [Cerioporus squamosus]|nr:hypothetical protein C8T65DRAFT_748981 [Cerioporus squamosus]